MSKYHPTRTLVEMARAAQHDDRQATGKLYGDLADRIEALEAKLNACYQMDSYKRIEALEATLRQPIMPEKLTGELACILEDCSPPDKQSDEAVAALILSYQSMWDQLRVALTPEQNK